MKTTDLPKTIFLDIDGCIVEHEHKFSRQVSGKIPRLLPRVKQTCMKWHNQGHRIILTTGRTEVLREVTEKMLQHHGVIYDQLIMSLGPGPRVLINDLDPNDPSKSKAIAINLKRDQGIGNIDLDFHRIVVRGGMRIYGARDPWQEKSS